MRGLEQGSCGFLQDRGHFTISQGASAMSEPDKNASDSELRARLGSLKTALGQAEGNEKPGASPAGRDGAMAGAVSSGFRAATDLAGGIIAGALIGILADRWLGTSPFLLIIFLVIGAIAGLRSVYRLGSRPTSGSTDDAPKD
ncbi:AtpZ/AtpI family protein [Bosea sp. (in: a-proteobacteria)]|uniref:AtpZ/AtpI family protein n=1 Tax=Bosea sp. (in: a-proteobacteria) TaxID=1871050 RepID=UPI0027350777|nr:AtpZ/AtpI family protein [Bosea sp. (in: a-proteobacteria)]MDP3407179.1 AtpZ/AtpI family protein [Bosea sp. (in: a-proteobacteria)]